MEQNIFIHYCFMCLYKRKERYFHVVTDKGFEEAKKIAKERAENFVKRLMLKDLILVFIKDMNGKTCSA